jgi:hypothetical protein
LLADIIKFFTMAIKKIEEPLTPTLPPLGGRE